MLGGVTVSAAMPDALERVYSNSTTFKRLSTFQGTDNSLEARLLKFTEFKLASYMWNGAPVPFIGAGFYVAPVYDSGFAKYRVGYGFHNAYLFAFEQGGAAALVLFIAFLISCWQYLGRARRSLSGAAVDFVNAITAVFVATLVIAMVGHGFWFGSTMHFSFYLLTLYLIAGRIPDQGRSR